MAESEDPPSVSGTDGTGGSDGTEGGGPAEQKPTPPCCKDSDSDCDPRWTWPWPWPWPHDPDDPDPPGEPNPSDGHGGGGLPQGVPPLGGVSGPGVGLPEFSPSPEDPFDPEVVDAVPGAGLPAADAGTVMNVPVVVAPLGTGPGAAAAGAPGPGAGPNAPTGPRQMITEPPPARQPPPQVTGVDIVPPASTFRIGYGEKLRSAGMPQIAVLALPGVIGILILTGAGGLLGYRQAKAGQTVRSRAMTRFMN